MTSNRDKCLILFVDDDKVISEVTGKYLSSLGYRVALAANGKQALELFGELKPQVVVADLCMPVMDGLQFLEETRKKDSVTPVIVTTGYPDIETAIRAIQHGAFDYIRKPFKLELLHQKIERALRINRDVRTSAVYSELAALHDLSHKLVNIHNVDKLLDETFRYCLDVTGASSAFIQTLDRRSGGMITRRSSDGSTLADDAEVKPLVEWVITHGHPLLVVNGKTMPETDVQLDERPGRSLMFVPLTAGDDLVGVVGLARDDPHNPFTSGDINVLDVLASQAAIALNNAHLYASVGQKLEELTLVSTYSEQLAGLMDRTAIIEGLFDTVLKHFELDVMAFLIIQKRRHLFLFWSRGRIEGGDRDFLRDRVVSYYNETSPREIMGSRVILRELESSGAADETVGLPMVFESMLPVAAEDFSFGVVYFGSTHGLENEKETSALLSSLVSQTRIALTNAKLYGDMKENYIKTIKALAIAVDAKDTYTHGHSENVMNIAADISEVMGIDEQKVGVIRDAALLHDIGKIGIPGYILNKPGPLTYEEFNGVMKTHSTLGANIVRDVPFLQDLYPLILYHHEDYDGSGYPEGREGDEIPIGARIIHVADAFEAMTSKRPYRNSLGNKEALRRLIEGRGTHFDPAVVDALMVVARRKGWAEPEEEAEESTGTGSSPDAAAQTPETKRDPTQA
ncbi:MAG: response regulator [Chitinivibrionales bacterium]|nr:response regulator [Chitinivibrionales bacterium]